MRSVDIARVCHEINRAYCAALGDHSQPAWDDAPDWQRQSAVTGVEFTIANPDAGPSASHDSWLAEKQRDGWTYGPVKDPEKKEHPCFVPYDQLPLEQKVKDYLFQAVVRSISPVLRLTGHHESQSVTNVLPQGEALEAAIAAKPGAKISKADIEGRISDVAFYVLPNSTVTICSILLDNGFSVRGESACVDPANFDRAIGDRIAYENAFDKLWPLFGFMLAEKRHQPVEA